MKLESIYITTNKFKETVDFYEKILDQKAIIYSKDRYVYFSCPSVIAIYNEEYDERLINEDLNISSHFNNEYISNFIIDKEKKNNIITLNFTCEDLKEEVKRIHECGLKTSEIMYVNISKPYWYFEVKDPNGNTLEITGKYTKQVKL